MILRGSRIKGHVSAVGNGFHPRLLLSFDEIETERGWVPLMATITAVPGEHGLKALGEEGEIEREGQGGGAISDRRVARSVELTGRQGAAIGAGIGAAAGVVERLFSDRRLQLQKGTMLEIRLDRPLQVPWR